MVVNTRSVSLLLLCGLATWRSDTSVCPAESLRTYIVSEAFAPRFKEVPILVARTRILSHLPWSVNLDVAGCGEFFLVGWPTHHLKWTRWLNRVRKQAKLVR